MLKGKEKAQDLSFKSFSHKHLKDTFFLFCSLKVWRQHATLFGVYLCYCWFAQSTEQVRDHC